jgi:hypothetical protein
MARKRSARALNGHKATPAAVEAAVYGPPVPPQVLPADTGDGAAWGIWCVRGGGGRRDYSAGWLQADDRFPLVWHKRYAVELVHAALVEKLGRLAELSIGDMPQNIVRQASQAPEWFDGEGRECILPWSNHEMPLPFGDADDEPPPKGEGVDDDLIHGERAEDRPVLDSREDAYHRETGKHAAHDDEPPPPAPEPVPLQHLVALRAAEALEAVAERKREQGELGRWAGKPKAQVQGLAFQKEGRALAFVAEALRVAARTGRPIVVQPEDA